MCETQQSLYNILHHWMHATEEEVTFVKMMLMPEDDADRITFCVTEHLDINPDGTMYIAWFDIDVYDRDKSVAIGSMIVRTSDGHIVYDFLE